jgi:hypothetical protein
LDEPEDFSIKKGFFDCLLNILFPAQVVGRKKEDVLLVNRPP